MYRSAVPLVAWFACTASLCGSLLLPSRVCAQAGLRESLERLDRDRDGEISPDEITPRARPYLERISRTGRLSLDRTNSIEEYQEAARIYHAFQNGARGRNIRPDRQGGILPFGPEPGEPLVPEFGLAEVRYPYTQDDLNEADRTLRRSDRNDDGFIDRAEAAEAEWTHRDPFEMDLNGDERLSRMELAQRYARRRLLDRAAGELIRKAWRTGNGIRSSGRDDDRRRGDSDWRRRGSGYWLTGNIMERFDRNRNGRLELEESQSLGLPFGQLDIDRDGELSRQEVYDYLSELQEEINDETEGLPGWFFELDADRDGQVAMSEFASEWTPEKLEEFAAFDLNGDGLLTAAEAFQSKAMVGGTYRNETAQVLPPRQTVISEIQVDEDYRIADLNVRLSITHTYVSQLDVYLVGPDEQRVELFAGIGGSNDNFEDTVLDDQADYPITKARAPYRGSYLPGAAAKRQTSLSHFNGKSVQGVWQLVIRCTRSERFGMLHNWGLIVRPQEDLPREATPDESREADASDDRGDSDDDRDREGRGRESSRGEGNGDSRTSGSGASPQGLAARIIASADKNKDGVLTIDEYPENERQRFASTDANGDGRVDAGEIEAAIRRIQRP